jgi:prepilin-type N-terminal cleavage/methylation domain-containing protein
MLHEKNMRGFTLTELLVAIFIMGLLATMSFASIGNIGESKKTRLDAVNFASALSEMKYDALSGKQTGGVLPSGGYCVAILPASNTQYITFADKNNDHAYDVSDAILETNVLDRGVFFYNEPAAISLCYLPNDPKGTACLSSGACGTVTKRTFSFRGVNTLVTRTVDVWLNNGVINVNP